MILPSAARPAVISSNNGNRSKGADGKVCVQKAYEMIVGGSDVLDALIAGVNIVELDPEDSSVGYGGLPNADGVVQLDASCMHGPRKRAGCVAALEGVRTPSLVAKAVMENTDHHLLVGAGAQAFARNLGFTIEADLNTPLSRGRWLEWKRRTDPLHYLDPKERAEAGVRVGLEMVREGLIEEEHFYGTINCDGVSARGEVCGTTTTSGLAFKIPGRVGDSPILGAGLWVDNDVGAAGSTGRGEANLYGLCSFVIVESMRKGMAPKDAGMEALRRVQKATVEKRLLNSRGLPSFGLSFYILNARGEHAGVTMYPGTGPTPQSYAVCDEKGPRSVPCEPLFEGRATD
ncbi:MAG: N(4)-(beta-N-acetylglucosaminyl)-L-asparaginase [Gemmatimonadetes bacterium]|nr:N(4)-(beta-N-acetylglucosaminyl)-L-asparaginase [Gemmatimonadota bacterium]